MKFCVVISKLLLWVSLVLFSVSSQAQDTDWQGWPSADEADGRFISIVGPRLSINYNDIIILVGVPVTATNFDIDFFDGDAGLRGQLDPNSHYDQHRPGFATPYSYELYESQSRSAAGGTLILSRTDDDFADNQWTSFATDLPADHGVPVDLDDNFYWYRLELKYEGDIQNDRFWNGLKIRVRSNGSTLSSVSVLDKIVVVGAPISSNDPDLEDPNNTYDGNWAFPVRIAQGVIPPLDFTDADADHVDDLADPDGVNISNPGAPKDDNDSAKLRVSPNIQYEIIDPFGQQLIFNSDPSGNIENETFSYNPPVVVPAGEYIWNWTGVDAGNTLVLQTNGEIFPPPPEGQAVIGNYVWVDENSDGMQDVGEPGLANVTVNLLDINGNFIASRITDSEGQYLFMNVTPGTYQVVIDEATLPVGITQTTNPVLPGADFGNQTSPYLLSVNAGGVNLTADFGFNFGDADNNQGPGALGDQVWIDLNGDGIQAPGEVGISDVTLTIFGDSDGDGVVDPFVDGPYTAAVDQNGDTGTGTTTTNSDGGYEFSNLENGQYIVIVDSATLPAGYVQTADPDNFGGPSGGAADFTDNQTTTAVIIAPGDNFLNVDFGYQADTAVVNSVGDTVYFDINANGVEDAGEPGIANVTVALIDSNGNSVGFDVTDANGMYLFDGLVDGDYTVEIVDGNGILAELQQSGDPDAILDGSGSANLTGGISVLTLDFGYTAADHQTGTGLIGDTVFFDINQNNIFEDGEGLSGVTVILNDASNTVLLAETVTNSDGFYTFGGLDFAADYNVVVDTATLPAGLFNSVDPDGANDNQSFVSLSTDPDGIDLDQDFGYITDTATQIPGSIGDLVWLDSNANGQVDAGEAGIEDITLDLYVDTNGDGALQVGEPRIATASTDAFGNYLFDNLPAGDYIVDVTDENTKLNGFWHSLGTADTNDNSQSDPYAVNLPDGGAIVTADFGYYAQLASLGDFVWFDEDANGIQDSGENGIEGVQVNLNILYPDGSTIDLTTFTDPNGLYSFDNLLADEDYNGDTSDGSTEPVFTLTAVSPNSELTFSPVDNVSDDSIDSDDPNGELAETAPGGNDDTNDFGLFDLGSITGNVSEDTDRDGVIEPGDGEGPLSGVTINLYFDNDSNGIPDDINFNGIIDAGDLVTDAGGAPFTTTTDSLGNYQFQGVPAGTVASPASYVVQEIDPAGFESLQDGDISNDGDPFDGITTPPDNFVPVTLTLSTGPDVFAEDDFDNNFVDTPLLAKLGDLIWFDHNADGVQDLPGEIGVSGIAVNLLDSGGTTVDTTTTDGTGFYEFTDLVAGTYTVVVDPASFTTVVEQTYDLDDGVTTSPATPDAATVTLTPGEANNDVDFGYRPLGTIGDIVWNDLDASGDINGSETGISGVTVILTGTVNDSVITDSNGFYEFADLPTGVYTVTVSGTPLDGLQQTHDLDDPVTVNPATPDTANVELVLNATSDAVVSRDDVDFGYREQGAITGTVKEDLDGDGAGDRGIVTTVELFADTDGDGNPDGTAIDSTTTAADGSYAFADVSAGDYVVIETQPAGLVDVSDQDTTPDGDSFDADTTVDNQVAVTVEPGETDSGNDFVDENQGSVSGTVKEDTTGDGLGDTDLADVTVELFADTNSDGNPDGVALDSMSTGSDGSYMFENLSPGDYVVVETQPAGLVDVSDQDASPDGDPFDGDTTVDNQIAATVEPGEADTDNNFVEVNQGGITGNVSEDQDGIGTNPNVPIQGVVIELFADTNGDGNPDGAVIETTTTDSNGDYSFSDLMPGDYVVVETQPANLDSISDQDESPDGDPFDGDTTVDDQIAVTLEAGETDAGNNFVEENQGSISGSVLEDTNGDGAGDTPQVGVTVTVHEDTNGNGVLNAGEPQVDTTTTAVDGSYSFDPVSPGNYVVIADQSAGLTDVSDQDQSPDGDPQDADTTVDNSIGVAVEPGEADTDNDFVDENQGSISGSVLEDTNGDGLGDTGQGGVTVTLYEDTNGNGVFDIGEPQVDSTTTATDGSYSFDPVSPGQYVVVAEQVPGLADIFDNDETPEDGNDGSTPVDNMIPANVEPGEADNDNNFVDVNGGGSISGTVTQDTTGDGAGDTGIQAVILELFAADANGNPVGSALASMSTGADGGYLFTGLQPGNYVVVETQPAGFNSLLDQDETPDGDSFDTDATIDEQVAVTLLPGESDTGNNFAEQAPASIEGQVLVDNDGDGNGDTGLGGVEITLQDSTGADINSTTTGSDGSYSFTDLTPGDYTVVETQPAGYNSVSDQDQQPDGDPQDSDQTVDDQIGVNLISAETDAGNDFVEELPQTCPAIINFDTDADGNNLAAGTIIDDEYQGFGITVTTNDPVNHPAMIFNSLAPTGGDNDLGTPNQDFGGPGVGAGGAVGTPGENAIAEGNILIISEDSDSSDPDDNAGGGTLIFTFDTPYEVASVTMIDIENSTETYEVRAYDAGGALITTSTMQGLGNNSRELVNVDAQNVSRLEIEMSSSGGVANIDIVCPDEPSIDIRKQQEGEDSRTFEPGATVDFEIAVTNTGAVDLTNVEVSDPQVPACDNTIGNLAVGQTVVYTCSVVLEGGSSTSKTWLDDFSPKYSYSGNDGNTNFLGNWIENDPQGGGASSGRVLVGSNNKLWMNNYNYPGGSNFKPSAQRAVDLSGMQSATLSFDWITHSGVDSNDAVALEVSTNGGSSFTEIDKFWGKQTSTKQESFDVSAYISSNTIFRFRVTNYYGGSNETFKVDNFKIQASGSDAAEGFVNIAYATGDANGQTVTDSDPSEVVVDSEPAVVCEECVNGYSKITLKISAWASNRDTSERIRVREGGLGGTVLYDSIDDGNPNPSIPNGGTFTFSVNNPGATIVVTVQGDNHAYETVKATFITNCDLYVNQTSGNSYITFKIIDFVDDSQNGDCDSDSGENQNSTIVFEDDFESSTGWTFYPHYDTATKGNFEIGYSQFYKSSGVTMQLQANPDGSNGRALVTGTVSGSSHDVDNGYTYARSPMIVLPNTGTTTLNLNYYLAHLSNSSSADYLLIRVYDRFNPSDIVEVVNKRGVASEVAANWMVLNSDISNFNSKTIHVEIFAADESGASLVEAAIDEIMITNDTQ